MSHAQVAATRDRILDAVADVIERGDEPTVGAVAEAADVKERTVYRHFATRDELYAAFWQHVHDRRLVGGEADAADLGSLRALVAASFAGFSENEPLVRAMLHSRDGRAMRLGANPRRRARHQRVVDGELPDLPATARRRAAAAAHILLSAMAWEYLRDYWGMTTQEAIATSQQALTALFRGLGKDNA